MSGEVADLPVWSKVELASNEHAYHKYNTVISLGLESEGMAFADACDLELTVTFCRQVVCVQAFSISMMPNRFYFFDILICTSTRTKKSLEINLKSVQEFFRIGITNLVIKLFEGNILDSLKGLESHLILETVCLTCQFDHPIQQLAAQEELHHESVVRKEECRDLE